MRWSRQYAFKMLIFQSILTGEDMFGYSLSITCGDGSVATKTSYVEILNFRHFFKHIVFTSEGDKIRNKEIKNYINVSVVVDIESGNTNN